MWAIRPVRWVVWMLSLPVSWLYGAVKYAAFCWQIIVCLAWQVVFYEQSPICNNISEAYYYIYYCIICHPSPSNNQHEHTICINYYILVAWQLLTPDHYQQWMTIKIHIKCCTLDDKIFSYGYHIYAHVRRYVTYYITYLHHALWIIKYHLSS